MLKKDKSDADRLVAQQKKVIDRLQVSSGADKENACLFAKIDHEERLQVCGLLHGMLAACMLLLLVLVDVYAAASGALASQNVVLVKTPCSNHSSLSPARGSSWGRRMKQRHTVCYVRVRPQAQDALHHCNRASGSSEGFFRNNFPFFLVLSCIHKMLSSLLCVMVCESRKTRKRPRRQTEACVCVCVSGGAQGERD